VNGRRRPQAKIREEADDGRQGRANQTRTAAYPTQRRGQGDIVGAQGIGSSLQTRRSLHHGHHVFNLRQRPRKPCRQMVWQQTERAMALGTIPARNPCPRWRHPGVRTMAGKPATAFRVERATRKTCAAPQLQGNVFAAGVTRTESKLHRQPARVGGDLRGPSSFDGDRPKINACRRSSEPLSAGRAWTACGRPADRVDNANSRVAHTRPQPAHPRSEYPRRFDHPALRA